MAARYGPAIKPDPKMKRVGKRYVCSQCGGRLNEVTVAQQDPFCTTTCAKAHHGVVIQTRGQGYTVASSS